MLPVLSSWTVGTWLCELLATLVIMTASSSLNAFMMDVDRISNGDVFAGADSISFITSAMVTVENVSSIPPTDAGR